MGEEEFHKLEGKSGKEINHEPASHVITANFATLEYNRAFFSYISVAGEEGEDDIQEENSIDDQVSHEPA